MHFHNSVLHYLYAMGDDLVIYAKAIWAFEYCAEVNDLERP